MDDGRIGKKFLSQRAHDLPCGYKDDHDHAASLVILERGSHKARSERPELMLVDRRKLLASVQVQRAALVKHRALPERDEKFIKQIPIIV